jgi:hypothetical protein
MALMIGLEDLVAVLEVGDGREETAVATIERVVRAEDMVGSLRKYRNVERQMVGLEDVEVVVGDEDI